MVNQQKQYHHHCHHQRFRVGLGSTMATNVRMTRKDVGDDDLVTSWFDTLVENGQLGRAVQHLRDQNKKKDDANHRLVLTEERWSKLFDAVEKTTRQAVGGDVPSPGGVETSNPWEYLTQINKARVETNNLYRVLQESNKLTLFGAVSAFPAAGGSRVLSKELWEEISGLPFASLSPNPVSPSLIGNSLLLAVVLGGTLLTGTTFFGLSCLVWLWLVVCDDIVLNGALSETYLQLFVPDAQERIVRHEAGHFLCAYLTGYPLEGYSLSSWDSLDDPRLYRQGVTLGTMYFDPNSNQERREEEQQQADAESLDRYCVVVMAGIAAEAISFGTADGGEGDEMDLISFLAEKKKGNVSASSIRNRARWAVLQAILLIRLYQPCYDALVSTMRERKGKKEGNLGACILAIERSARQHRLKPLDKPLGFMVDGANESGGEWRKLTDLISMPSTK